MEKLKAIIERGADGGFAIRCESVPGLIGSGLTEEEARADFLEVMQEQAEYYAECHGEAPQWQNAEVEFRYDLAAFFQAFPFLNASEFARQIGINPSLMRKYKQGISTASARNRALIQEQLDTLLGKLQHVQL